MIERLPQSVSCLHSQSHRASAKSVHSIHPAAHEYQKNSVTEVSVFLDDALIHTSKQALTFDVM